MKSALVILAMVVSVSSIAGTGKRKVASIKDEQKAEKTWSSKLRMKMGNDFKGIRSI